METCATSCRCAAKRKRDFVSLDDFFSGALFGQRDIVLHYDRGGLSFGSSDSQADFRRALEGYDSFHGTTYSQSGCRGIPTPC